MNSLEKKREKKALGRGLQALVTNAGGSLAYSINGSLPKEERHDLIQDQERESPQQEGQLKVQLIEISLISPNPNQPRKEFDEEELQELEDSIKTLGILQPVLVRPSPDKKNEYQLVAGERRWRAALRAGVKVVPALIQDLDEKEILQIGIVENVQRQQLNPIEESRAYNRLANEFELSQDQVAQLVGKSRVAVANSMRLVKLDGEVLKLVENGSLSTGHAKVLLGVREPQAQRSLAKRVLIEGLSVRALEKIIPQISVLDSGLAVKMKNMGSASSKKFQDKHSSSIIPAHDSELSEVESRLREIFGTKVSVTNTGQSGVGKLSIYFYSSQDLNRIIDLIDTN
jgi:ParB family transcriptional regulator, chromosome partitioning protein